MLLFSTEKMKDFIIFTDNQNRSGTQSVSLQTSDAFWPSAGLPVSRVAVLFIRIRQKEKHFAKKFHSCEPTDTLHSTDGPTDPRTDTPYYKKSIFELKLAKNLQNYALMDGTKYHEFRIGPIHQPDKTQQLV